jgi:hypothetical protein
MMTVTMRHHFDFGPSRALVGEALSDAESWDALRMQGGQGFRIASSEAEHGELASAQLHTRQRMVELAGLLARDGVESVVSYGVGTAVSEYWLRRLLPDVTLVLTEVGPCTCARLKVLFPGVRVLQHDLRTDPPVSGDLHLFNRLDTEFSNNEWRALLRRFATQRIVFCATETLTWRRAIVESVRALQPGTATAGWLRNRAGFESFLGTAHDYAPVTVGVLPTWRLSPLRHVPESALDSE